jgi:hypothetical protein
LRRIGGLKSGKHGLRSGWDELRKIRSAGSCDRAKNIERRFQACIALTVILKTLKE